jgi:hypothetical protein
MGTQFMLWFVLGVLGQAENPNEAYFEFSDARGDTFVIKLVQPRKIAHARAILRGEEVEGRSVMGIIVKRPADYNPGWSFHLKPRSIHFFDFAIEVCDASIIYTQEHLREAGGAFLPGRRWCPWSSRLTREVTAQVLLIRYLGLGPKLFPQVHEGKQRRDPGRGDGPLEPMCEPCPLTR